jgi:fructose-1-phosphate kinase PfkB-like protein
LFTDGARFWRLIPPAIKPVSPIGSGDSFAGGFAVALARGTEPIEAARLGVACGTANALTLQAGFLNRDEVERLQQLVRVEDA